MNEPKDPLAISPTGLAWDIVRNAAVNGRLRHLRALREAAHSSQNVENNPYLAFLEQWEPLRNAQRAELSEEADKLRETIAQKLETGSPSEQPTLAEELEATLYDLGQNEKLQVLANQTHPALFQKIKESKELRQKFLSEEAHNFFVMSIDIRRSTELMLKARSPKLFAEFISAICFALQEIVLRNCGVFDKFTGDGILAYFPEFFSGEETGLWIVKAAQECHRAFREIYAQSYDKFIAVPASAGLGIGIDYGQAHLLQVVGGLTVIGAPVVYACRMGGAPASTTLLNQPAYEQIRGRFQAECVLSKTEIDLKHEGPIFAYAVGLASQVRPPKFPKWVDAETALKMQG